MPRAQAEGAREKLPRISRRAAAAAGAAGAPSRWDRAARLRERKQAEAASTFLVEYDRLFIPDYLHTPQKHRKSQASVSKFWRDSDDAMGK